MEQQSQVTSHDITLVLFQRIITLDYKNKYLVTGYWSQSIYAASHFDFG